MSRNFFKYGRSKECDLKGGQYKRLETCEDMDPEGQSTLCQLVHYYPESWNKPWKPFK